MVIIPHLVESVTPNMWSSQFLMIVRILATGIIQTKEEVVVTLHFTTGLCLHVLFVAFAFSQSSQFHNPNKLTI